MKITDLTENDVIHIRNKKEAKGIAKLICPDFGGVGYVNVRDKGRYFHWNVKLEGLEINGVPNIIPASKFLKPSIKKDFKRKAKAVEAVMNRLMEVMENHNERIKTLNHKPSNDLEVHFDEVEKLPEKWCVLKTPDNWKEVGEWFQKNSQAEPCITDYGSKMVYIGDYLHYPAPHPEKYHAHSRIKKGYTEISFETFKRLVLKEDERPVEKEFGKWYKDEHSKALLCYTACNGLSDLGYGFDVEGEWMEEGEVDLTGLVPATDEEVKDALIKEAERRGFKEGVGIKSIVYKGCNTYLQYDGSTHFNGNEFYFKGCCLMKDGEWAEIIQPEAIDFSKAGQLVKSNDGTVLLYTTDEPAKDEYTFSATVVKSDIHKKGHTCNNWLIKMFTLCTEQVTLSN